MGEIGTFVERLKRVGVEVVLHGNYPWVYLYSVNGNVVKEKFRAEHGFTLAYMPIKEGQNVTFTDIGEIFKIIRKYKTAVNDKYCQ